jgi:hypothetical protein
MASVGSPGKGDGAQASLNAVVNDRAFHGHVFLELSPRPVVVGDEQQP